RRRDRRGIGSPLQFFYPQNVSFRPTRASPWVSTKGESHVKKPITAAAVVVALALAGTAASAIVPGTFADTAAHAACVKATAANGTLHLEKTCDTSIVASAFGTINNMNGQTFASGSFT